MRIYSILCINLVYISFLFIQNLSFAQSTTIDSLSPNFIRKDYFVLDPNVKLIYESTFGETESTTRIVGKDYVQEFIGSDFKMIQQVTSGSDHYSIISLEQELKILFMTAHSIKITYNEPAKIVSLPISKVNKTIWNGLEYTNEEEVDTITITSAFIGNEVIETEAGKFDCIKLEYIITKSSGKINKYYEWRAPDVGLVQLTAEVDNKGFVGLMTKLLSVDVIFFVLKEIRKF